MTTKNNYIVAKFGGTSLANFTAMTRCANIVLNNPTIRVVVLSASSGVTDLLTRLAENKQTPCNRKKILSQVYAIQQKIVDEIETSCVLTENINKLHANLCLFVNALNSTISQKQADEILSYGERFSSLIFLTVMEQAANERVMLRRENCLGKDAGFLKVDAFDILRTNSAFGKAIPDITITKALCEEHLLPLLANNIVVTQGFIGADHFGNITTLGRGGSDYSAALFSEALNAQCLQIWTDVDGIYTTDPRITLAAKPMPELNFTEAAELATFGAKVLHPATLLPAKRANIDVFIGSSLTPNATGTWIKRQVSEPGIRAIALRDNQTLLTLTSPDMLLASGFLARVFAILAKHELSVDLITTSEISVALTLDKQFSNQEITNHSGIKALDFCLQELKDFCSVTVEARLALIAVIGNHTYADGKNNSAGRLFSALAKHQPRLICHGASIHNICFLVEQQQAKGIVEKIHEEVFIH